MIAKVTITTEDGEVISQFDVEPADFFNSVRTLAVGHRVSQAVDVIIRREEDEG